MAKKKNIFAINGSASSESLNLALLKMIAELTTDKFDVRVFNDLTALPHFRTEQTDSNTPDKILEFRESVLNADGVLFCTPEYIFSIPSGLKNAIEWCVAATVFSNKPIGIITASASGLKGHEELKLIMKTIEAHYADETTLLIQGVKGKINKQGNITCEKTKANLLQFIEAFARLLEEASS
jgi:chromate reductase